MHANVRYNKLTNRDKSKRPTKVSIPLEDACGGDLEPIMSRDGSDDEEDDDIDNPDDDQHSSNQIRFYANT